MSLDIPRLRRELNDKLDDTAHAMGKFPKQDPFEHGVQVGKYAAIKEILDSLNQMAAASGEDE